jgi:hypothetical protein
MVGAAVISEIFGLILIKKIINIEMWRKELLLCYI